MQRIVSIMPRLAQRLQPCCEALQAAKDKVDAKAEVDHPKHALLRDQLQRISAHQQVGCLIASGGDP